jgi:membrane dipeptidase
MPDLVALLMARGATDAEIRLFAGENLIRVWREVEQASKRIQATGEMPSEEVWDGRNWKVSSPRLPRMFRKDHV